MNNMTLRVEIVECMQDHMYQDLQDIGKNHTAYKPSAIEPQRLTRSFQDETAMGPQFLFQCKGFGEFSDDMPPLCSGFT
jgi:hypothetical protein